MAMEDSDIEELVSRLKEDAYSEPSSDQHKRALQQSQEPVRDYGPAGNFASEVGGLAETIIRGVKGREQQSSLEEFDRALGSEMARVQTMEEGPERQYAMQKVMSAVNQREKLAKMKGNIIKYLDQSGLPETSQIKEMVKKVAKQKPLSSSEKSVLGKLVAQAGGDENNLLSDAVLSDPQASKALGAALERRLKTTVSQLRYGGAVSGLQEQPLPKDVADRVTTEGSPSGAVEAVRGEKDQDALGKKLDNLTKLDALRNPKKGKEGESAVGAASLDKISVTKNILAQAKDVLEGVDVTGIGKFSGNWRDVAGQYGLTSEPEEQARAMVKALRRTVLKEGGKTLTESEIKIIQEEIPNTDMPPARFFAQLYTFLKNRSRELDIEVETQGQAGKNVEELREGIRSYTKKPTGGEPSSSDLKELEDFANGK